MTGNELDRAIAEIRGDEWYTWCVECDTTAVGTFDSCPACGASKSSLTSYPKPCSTEIVHAMELWEEMFKSGMMPVIRTIFIEEGEYGYRVYFEHHNSYSHEAWKLTETISWAYYKWRKGE